MMIALLLVALSQIGPAPVTTPSAIITVGDGVSSIGTFNGDDERPFQAAVTKAKAGGVIEVLAGHWRFRRPVTIGQDGVTLRGSAGSRVHPAATGPVGTFRITGNHVRISGLHFKVVNATANQSVVLGLGDSIAIDHCTFHALDGAAGLRLLAFGDGVALRRGTLVESNTFLFSDQSAEVTGVTLRFGLDLRFANNEFRRTQGTPGLCRIALEILEESKGTITSNSFQNLGTPAQPMHTVIYSNAEAEGHHFAFVGNFIENCLAPQTVHLAGGRFCAVTGNVFGRLGTATNGVIRITASAGGNVGESNVISGNQFHNVALGIATSDTLWTNINGNQFTICAGPMIAIGANAHGALINANQFIGASVLTAPIPHAISIGTSGDHLVHDNLCSSQNATFSFQNVVSSQSAEASIKDNVNS